MNNSLRALVYRHLLLESKFIVLGISVILFLAVPYFKIVTIGYHEFKSAQYYQRLLHDFKTTTGVINKIYQVKSYLPGRSSTYVLEFSYLDQHAKINTLDKNYLATNKIGDQVLVLYNQDAAAIEHITPYVLPSYTLNFILSIATIFLLFPTLFSVNKCIKSLLHIKRIYQLHVNGTQLKAQVAYFKPLRNNAYVVEYLYMPPANKIKLRAKVKATNYLQIGEKHNGDVINILYDVNKLNETCIDEINYE